ncbi:MAG: hypothetical protein J5858_16930 [Lentisphaeria bacterium]|nr:hypothetical protein [Lentisphaeria bacterium]
MPRDLLFFRDARPMEGSWTGQGAGWPQGGTLHGALLSALQQFCKTGPGDYRFSSLRTVGPFPEKNGDGKNELFFPAPLDLMPDGSYLVPREPCGGNNLPKPLSKILISDAAPTKDNTPHWLSGTQYLRYLAGEPLCGLEEPTLYDVERRPGIAMNSQSRTANEFYMAEYLRLAPGTDMAAIIQLNDSRLLEDMFQNGNRVFHLGGQQCCVRASLQRVTDPLMKSTSILCPPEKVKNRVKWVLLTPACWAAGWCPWFIDMESGRVMLKSGFVERKAGESRETWRSRKADLPNIDAVLTAARIGSAQIFTGWRMGNGKRTAGPRATRLLVPAGSVFYFETAGRDESLKLMAALSGKFFSKMGGEYGYGLGVCTVY